MNSNVLAVKSPSSYQFGSASGTYESVSQTPISQSGSFPASSVSSQRAPGSPAYAKILSPSGTYTSHATSRQGSRSQFTSTSQDSSRSKLTASSSQFVSAQGGSASLGGLSSQSQSTSSPVSSAYPSLGSLSMAVSGTSSVKTSQLFSSGSPGGSSRLTTSHLSGLAQGVSSHPVGSYVQSQGSPSRLAFGSPQYASASIGGAHTTSNRHKQASAQSLSQIPQKWQPSATSFSQGSPITTAMSQSRFSVPSTPASRKSLASGGPLGQSAPASLYSSASMPSPQRGSSLYSQASGSVFSMSQSQAPQRWQPSASLSSQGFQTSSSAVSQSSSPSPSSAKFPNRLSLASGSGPSHPVSTQGASSYGGLTQSLGYSAPHAPAYSKPASPLGDPSLFTSSQSNYASKSQRLASGTVGASRRYVSAQGQVGSNIASLQPQVAAGHYAPAPMDVKVPVYNHPTSSGSSMSSSPPPTTSGRLSSRFPSSGAALTQTSSSPQNVQSFSRFSSVAGGTSLLSTQSAGSYAGPSQSQGSVGQYTSGSPAFEKFGSSSLGVSIQSASGPSSSSQYSPISTTVAGGQLTSSSGYPSAQGESGSAHYAPAYSKPASPLGDPSLYTSSQSHYASKSQRMAGGTVGPSRRYVSAQGHVGSNIASLQPQVAAGHYAPAPMDVKVTVYNHPTSSGSSMSSGLQPTTSGSFPSSGAALTQTISSPQNIQSSNRFSSVAGGTSLLSTQSAGSYTRPSQSQGSVRPPYTPGSPAYDKFGTASFGVSSQSASGPSSSSQYSPISSTGASGQLTSSSGYLSGQGESGSSILSQGPLAKETLAPMDTSMSVSSQAAAVSSGIQASDAAAFQSGSSQASSSLSSLHVLSSPVYFVPQSASGSSQLPPFGKPTDSMSQSSGSNVQASSEALSSGSSQAQTLRESAGVAIPGLTGGSTSMLSGSYESSFGQNAPVSKPSQGSLNGYYYGVKG
ncbi:uncharacterized protein LOC130425877 [Triplophysa dalaica]|uniref:uncharacterized protein LOC130425877 n=1 Tax=Triplophysa dalaica TaxID=1582913 RepID=UPI0024DF3A54|nr:uncharacterized protein LOC130425877 [Triplophysa dalaica]